MTKQDKYASMIERAAIGIAQVSMEGVFLDVNPHYCEITGYSAEELIGRRFHEITYESDLEPDLENFKKALSGECSSFTMEKRYRRKNGELVWTSLTASLVRDEKSRPQYFVSTVQDITAAKDLQKRLQKFNAELETRVARKTRYLAATVSELEMAHKIAEENSQASKAFLAYMSHELRAPIGIIMGYSELMAESLPPNVEESFATWLSTIRRNAESLLRIVNVNLDISKVDAGKIELEFGMTDVGDLLKDVIFGFEVQARAKNITLLLEGEGAMRVITDPHRLRQIMMNMLGNAVKFTPDGGRVSVLARALDRGVAIEVRDTGIGMTNEQAENLFRPYAQAGRHISKQFGGTGLGLMLAKKIAQSLGGDILLLESAPGQGCRFEVRIAEGSLSEQMRR